MAFLRNKRVIIIMSFKHYVIKLHMTVSCSVVQQKILNKKYSVLYVNKKIIIIALKTITAI